MRLTCGRAASSSALVCLVLLFPSGNVATTQSAAVLGGRAHAQDHAGTFASYAVATAHPLASQAGAATLAKGGSAADGAAAAMLALGVVSPATSGLGGGGFALYYDAATREYSFLDFRETAPAASTANMFGSGEGDLSRAGGLATGVPGEPAGIEELLRRHGRLERGDVVAPALALAEAGFEVNTMLARQSSYFPEQLREDPTMAAWLDGRPQFEEGQRVRRPELAKTLRLFARHGAAPFYQGVIARAIVATNRAHGGILTHRDLASFRVVDRAPLTGQRFGFQWITAPLPSAGGYTLLASLALIEDWLPDGQRARMNDRLLHAFAESWKAPYWDRAVYFGDPDQVAVPLTALLAPERFLAQSAMFRPTLALSFQSYGFPLTPDGSGPLTPAGDHGTSHLCVIDAAGNVASVTTTVNYYFGARYTAAGMVMNNEMDDFSLPTQGANLFDLVGGQPNHPAPGKRPISSMSPTIVADANGPVLCIGAAGGSRIPTVTEQVAYHVLVRGQDPSDAIAAPRIHGQGLPNKLYTEEVAPFAPQLVASLTARGHVVEEKNHLAVVNMIQRTSEGLRAASDPRAGGAPDGH